MTNQRSNKRRSFPPYDESSKLSRRDQTLVRVEKLLAEQFIAPPQEEAPPEEDAQVDLVDLEEAVETAQLPPEARPRPRAFAPRTPPPDTDPAPAPPPAAVEPPEKKSRLSIVSAILQAAILIFVLAWVFLLGILVGRGHLWQSGLGHDLVGWVEQKAGWSEKTGPEIILKKDNGTDEVIPPQGTTSEDQLDIDPVDSDETPDTESAGSGETTTGTGAQEEMPVWNWPGWTPGPADNPLGESESSNSATESVATPEPAPPTDNQEAAENPEEAATLSPSPGESEEEEYPTAIEEDTPGPAVEYQPPGDQDDYEAMLEPSEVPDASLAEAAPLPPGQVGAQGTGKYAVQVAQPVDANEAQRQVSLLISQGFNAYYYESNGKFPVRVGHFPTRQAADEVKIRLEELGHKEPYVSVLGN